MLPVVPPAAMGCLQALYKGVRDLKAFPPYLEKFVHLEMIS